MKHSKLVAVILGAGILAGAAHAQDSATLDKIKKTGTITLGVRDSSIPFSYLDNNEHYQGYSIDLCMKAVEAVKKQLGMNTLNVKMTPVTSATRIPLIENGTVDMACGSATNNAERQKQVAFSTTMYVSGTRLLAKKESHINTLDDLKGKTMVTTAGTTSMKLITKLNSERNMHINILPAKDHAEAFLMVQTGRAKAFLMDDILLASLAANSATPNAYSISKQAASVEPYGIILRRDDPAFKKVVDDAIGEVYKSGEINKLYAKWFQSPIPPKGVNLTWPMSDQLKRVIAHPTDSPDPKVYE